jgi:hypothetical protein
MKQVFNLMLLFFSSVCFGQTREGFLKKIYLEVGGGSANYNGSLGAGGVQAVFKDNWTVSASYFDISMNPKDLPSDYQAGYTEIFGLPIADDDPEQRLLIYSLTGGKLFTVSRKVWLITEAGFSLVKGDKFTFSRQEVISGGNFGYTNSNYSKIQQNENAFGGMFKAGINWSFLRFAGLGVYVFTNMNSIQSPLGIQFKLNVGLMHPKN